MLIFKRRSRLTPYARCYSKEIAGGKINEHSTAVDIPDGNTESNDDIQEKRALPYIASGKLSQKSHINEKTQLCPISESSTSFHNEKHNLQPILPTEKKKYPTKRCVVCLDKSLRKETRYYCSICMDSPALCKNKCFRVYHEASCK